MQGKLGVESWIKWIGYREGVKKKGGIGRGREEGEGARERCGEKSLVRDLN
jgi:hypothetical protein